MFFYLCDTWREVTFHTFNYTNTKYFFKFRYLKATKLKNSKKW